MSHRLPTTPRYRPRALGVVAEGLMEVPAPTRAAGWMLGLAAAVAVAVARVVVPWVAMPPLAAAVVALGE